MLTKNSRKTGLHYIKLLSEFQTKTRSERMRYILVQEGERGNQGFKSGRLHRYLYVPS